MQNLWGWLYDTLRINYIAMLHAVKLFAYSQSFIFEMHASSTPIAELISLSLIITGLIRDAWLGLLPPSLASGSLLKTTKSWVLKSQDSESSVATENYSCYKILVVAGNEAKQIEHAWRIIRSWNYITMHGAEDRNCQTDWLGLWGSDPFIT